MPNGKSRSKGKRGELDLVHRIGGSAHRVGHSYVATPVDMETDFAVYQVKNHTVGGALIADYLRKLNNLTPEKNAYVAFKWQGKWYMAESLDQHIADHGEKLKMEENNDN